MSQIIKSIVCHHCILINGLTNNYESINNCRKGANKSEVEFNEVERVYNGREKVSNHSKVRRSDNDDSLER
jgi:hypothetical protein